MQMRIYFSLIEWKIYTTILQNILNRVCYSHTDYALRRYCGRMAAAWFSIWFFWRWCWHVCVCVCVRNCKCRVSYFSPFFSLYFYRIIVFPLCSVHLTLSFLAVLMVSAWAWYRTLVHIATSKQRDMQLAANELALWKCCWHHVCRSYDWLPFTINWQMGRASPDTVSLRDERKMRWKCCCCVCVCVCVLTLHVRFVLVVSTACATGHAQNQ